MFRVTGRRDQVVQVGGTNVFTEHVRTVLLAHPQVREVAVRRMSDTEGERLKAFVVPTAEADPIALIRALDQWSTQHLTAPERPKAFTLGGRLPVNAQGKAADWSCLGLEGTLE